LPLYDSVGVGSTVTVSSIEALVPQLRLTMDPLVLHIRTPQRAALRFGNFRGNVVAGQPLLFCLTDFSPLVTASSSVMEADQVAMAVRGPFSVHRRTHALVCPTL
jgi:hypothetical protein